MTRFWQQRFHRLLDADLAISLTLALKAIVVVYGVLAGILNVAWFCADAASPHLFSAQDLLFFNLLLLGSLIFLCVIFLLFRHFMLLGWFRCKCEFITQLLSRKLAPPSHILLFGALATQPLLANVNYQAINQTIRCQTPHLYRVSNTPFPLFQQANLLVNP